MPKQVTLNSVKGFWHPDTFVVNEKKVSEYRSLYTLHSNLGSNHAERSLKERQHVVVIEWHKKELEGERRGEREREGEKERELA